MAQSWREKPVPPEVLRAPSIRSDSVAEQDAAAGGREARLLRLGDGSVATTSVALHRDRGGRRVYAYLRYKNEGRNHRMYVGEVSADTREEALQLAWKLVREKELLASRGARGLS